MEKKEIITEIKNIKEYAKEIEKLKEQSNPKKGQGQKKKK